MLKKLMKKKSDKKGFTLMELLIVVAIIAVLIAIAIPVFSGALNKAKFGANEANIRSWYAEQKLQLMTNDSYTAPTAYPVSGQYQLQGEANVSSAVTVTGSTADTFKVTYNTSLGGTSSAIVFGNS